MYTGLLHTHRLVVILFLIIYLVKTVLLLLNKEEQLKAFTKRFRVPEMIISTLFLLTGIVMLINKYPAMDQTVWMYFGTKLVAVFLAIPLAVVGFKRGNKFLAMASLILIISAYGIAEMGKRTVESKPLAVITNPSDASYDLQVHGKEVYQTYCIACHQTDGKGGVAGAKSLIESQRTDEEIKHLISNGKNSMPPYKKVLSAQDIEAVTAYIKKFRTSQP